MNPSIELKDHQKDAVHRIITSGNTLLHHVVGSGKTYTVCATIMKLKQYGLANKPMVIVPNHLVQQWSNEFRTLYPTANLLIANKEDLEKDNRKRFVSKVAIPNSKVVMHLKPVDKYKAVKRIDKCISEMETKQITSEKASEANSAETHRETMEALLDSLQTENEALLDVTLTVTAYNYLNNPNYKKAVRRSMLSDNFKVSTLYGLQTEGFKCSTVTPKKGLRNHEQGINSSSLAAVFPFVRTFVMDNGEYC